MSFLGPVLVSSFVIGQLSQRSGSTNQVVGFLDWSPDLGVYNLCSEWSFEIHICMILKIYVTNSPPLIVHVSSYLWRTRSVLVQNPGTQVVSSAHWYVTEIVLKTGVKLYKVLIFYIIKCIMPFPDLKVNICHQYLVLIHAINLQFLLLLSHFWGFDCNSVLCNFLPLF